MYTLLFSDPTGIEEPEASQLHLFPNPFRDVINIDTEAPCNYMIIDISGRLMLKGRVSEKGSIGVGGLTPGMYVIRISDNYKNIITRKIIKKHF